MKKTLLEVAYEMATGLYKAGVIDANELQEYKSLCSSPLDVESSDISLSKKRNS